MPKRPPHGLLAPGMDRSHFLQLTHLVMGESDRGCAIFCAAILADDLEMLLRSFMRTDPTSIKQSVDPLFGTYAPLASFSGRIQAAYALHLITRDVRDTLDTVRQIRNDFAHEAGPLTFDDQPCADRLRTLIGSPSPKGKAKKKSILDWRKPLSDAEIARRVAFLLIVAATSGVMGGVCRDIREGEDPRVVIARYEGSLQATMEAGVRSLTDDTPPPDQPKTHDDNLG